MAVRKVYGSLDSAETLKVMACLFELHLDFEFVPIRVDAGENANQPFLSLSPFGQLPAFEDGDFKQFESRAIIRSIAHGYAKKGEELIYWDSRKQAVVANWIDVEDHHFEPSAIELLTLQLNNQNNIGNYDQLVADAEAKLSKVLDIYESQLSKFNYLASDKYTIADVLHLPNLQRLMETPARKLVESRPRVNAWCSEILARPAWTKVLQMQLQAQAQAQSLAGPKLD